MSADSEDEWTDAQAAAFYALKAITNEEQRAEVIQAFCHRCGSVLGEGLAALMPGGQCPCDPAFDR